MWKAGILSLQALGATGSGAISNVVEATDYAVVRGASVINCSFGTSGFSHYADAAAYTAGTYLYAGAPTKATYTVGAWVKNVTRLQLLRGADRNRNGFNQRGKFYQYDQRHQHADVRHQARMGREVTL